MILILLVAGQVASQKLAEDWTLRKYKGEYHCNGKISNISDPVIMKVIPLNTSENKFQVKIDFEELIGMNYGMMKEFLGVSYAYLTDVDKKIYLHYDSLVTHNFKAMMPSDTACIMNLNDPLHSIWKSENIFFRHKVNLELVDRMYDPVIKDSTYLISVSGDKPVSHHDYLTSFIYSREHGFIKLTFTYDSNCYAQFTLESRRD